MRIPSVWCYPCWLCLQSLPAQPHPLSYIGRLWANLFLKAGSISRQKNYPSAPANPPPKLPQDLWICVDVRLKRCSGRCRPKLPLGLCLCLILGGMQWYPELGVPVPQTPLLWGGGLLLLRRKLSSSSWFCLPPTIVCLSACLSVCLPVFIPLCLSIKPRVDLKNLGQIAPPCMGRREMELGSGRAFITSPVTSSKAEGLQGLLAATR